MKRVRRSRTIQPLLRAVMVISSVTILATGVTFAALQSREAVLAGNSIQTAAADLTISTNGTAFDHSYSGFTFGEVVPGAGETAASTFYLKNSGTPALSLSVAVSSTPVNTNNVDLGKVYLVLKRADTGSTQRLALAALVNARASGGVTVTDSLAGGKTAQYSLQVAMDEDAFSGSEADISGIDLVFGGTAVAR